jgi:hypothetical protein
MPPEPRGSLFIVVSKQTQSFCVTSELYVAQAVLILSMEILKFRFLSSSSCIHSKLISVEKTVIPF